MKKSISMGGMHNQRNGNGIRSRNSLTNLAAQQQQTSGSSSKEDGSVNGSRGNTPRGSDGVFWGGGSSGSDDESVKRSRSQMLYAAGGLNNKGKPLSTSTSTSPRGSLSSLNLSSLVSSSSSNSINATNAANNANAKGLIKGGGKGSSKESLSLSLSTEIMDGKGVNSLPTSPSSSSSSVSVMSSAARQRLYMWRALITCIVLTVMGYFSYAISPVPLEEHMRPTHTGSSMTGSQGRHARALTVMINTYRRPPQIVDDCIEFYAQCSVVRYIYVVWSEENDPPQRLLAKYKRWKIPEVGFQKQKSSSLNNRFRPLNDVPHSDGIFSVDDDMRVPCSDLEIAYDVWQGSRDSLVGFMPRVHLRRPNGLLEYRCWWRVWWHGVYSIILTKAAIFNHKFLDLYTNTMPQIIRNMVDKEKNCEDIAMQFLIANVTGLPPVYVKGHLSDLGVFSGISTSQNIAAASHMDARSMCLNDLESAYGGINPLIPSRIIVDNANNWWVNVPSSWWEFISSDLWAGFFSDPD
jgi:hypothetical protein